jgi:hypothetical protein
VSGRRSLEGERRRRGRQCTARPRRSAPIGMPWTAKARHAGGQSAASDVGQNRQLALEAAGARQGSGGRRPHRQRRGGAGAAGQHDHVPLVDEVQLLGLASQIAIIGAACPHLTAHTVKPGTSAFGATSHPVTVADEVGNGKDCPASGQTRSAAVVLTRLQEDDVLIVDNGAGGDLYGCGLHGFPLRIGDLVERSWPSMARRIGVRPGVSALRPRAGMPAGCPVQPTPRGASARRLIPSAGVIDHKFVARYSLAKQLTPAHRTRHIPPKPSPRKYGRSSSRRARTPSGWLAMRASEILSSTPLFASRGSPVRELNRRPKCGNL